MTTTPRRLGNTFDYCLRQLYWQTTKATSALAEQVERLGQLPKTEPEAEAGPDGEVMWWTDLSAAADDAVLNTPSTAGHRRPN